MWTKEKLSQLTELLQTETRQDAANAMGCGLSSVKGAIKRFGIKYKKKSGGHYLYRDNPLDADLELTNEQKDLITGSLLGDGFMLKSNIFRIKQKESRREYIDILHKELEPFSTPVRLDKSRKPTRLKDGTVSHKLEHWKGEYTWSASFSTRTHRVFKELRNKWYPDGKKKLPKDLKLNAEIVTHWFLQDGYHNIKKKYYRISTQSFSEDAVCKLSHLLNDMLGINSNVQYHDGFVIYVTQTNGKDIFSKFLKENVFFDCFQYKL